MAATHSPLALLDGDLTVIAVSNAFGRLFDVTPAEVAGRRVFELGPAALDLPELRDLLTAAAAGRPGEDMAFELAREGREPRQLLAHAERLDYEDLDQVRVLMAITDISEATAAGKRAEDLREHNAMLVREARHRVANSLQIIASVLMQHARQTQSQETRGHLNNAHHRVMSVAALERHLAGSDESEVQVRPYLTKLCQSITASMIQDPDKVALVVSADERKVDTNVSVSLGLITTELVINAVKYAFPEDRAGTISVRYATTPGGWSLTVADDGVGVSTAPAAVAGLGTSIVQALANQLQAGVRIDTGPTGTAVSVTCPAPA